MSSKRTQELKQAVESNNFQEFNEILKQISTFNDPCHPSYLIGLITRQIPKEIQNQWISCLIQCDLKLWFQKIRRGGNNDIYRVFATILELQQPVLTQQMLAKVQSYKMDNKFPLYLYNSFGQYRLELLNHYLELYPDEDNIEQGLTGLLKSVNLTKAKQVANKYHVEKLFLESKCLSSTAMSEGLETIKYITSLNGFGSEHLKQLFKNAGYFRRPIMLEWLCKTHLNAFGNGKELLKHAFDWINKYGGGHCEESYIILIKYGYDDWEAIATKLIHVYPGLINFSKVEKVHPYIFLNGEEYIFQSFGIITPYMESKGYKDDGQFHCPENDDDDEEEEEYKSGPLSESGKRMYCSLDTMAFGNSFHPEYFDTKTLINCLSIIDEDDYDSEDEDDQKKLEEIKTKLEKYGQYRYWLDNSICKRINDELEHGNYASTDYPIWHLMSGIILSNNWQHLCDSDLNKFCKAYGISVNLSTKNKVGQIMQEQKKMFEELEEHNYGEDFVVRGYGVLGDLYMDMDSKP